MKKLTAGLSAAALGLGLALGGGSAAIAAKPAPPVPPIADANYVMGTWQDPTNTWTVTNTSSVTRDFLVKFNDLATGDERFLTLYAVQPGETRTFETARYSGEQIYVYVPGDYRWNALDYAEASDYDRYGRWYIHIDSDDLSNPVIVKRVW